MIEPRLLGHYQWRQSVPKAMDGQATLLQNGLSVSTTLKTREGHLHTVSCWWESEGWERRFTFGGIDQRGPASSHDEVFDLIMLTINSTIAILQRHGSPWTTVSGMVPPALPGHPAVPIPWYRFGFQLQGRPIIGGQRDVWARIRDLRLAPNERPGYQGPSFVPWSAMEWRAY